MRASMSVPGALAPVEIDGRLLVDGGIANNLPIDEARKLCGDVIIAVNISTPPLKREEITSALSVGGQLINFLGKVNVERQLASLGQRDVLIAPELGDISAGSFERAADAIRIGEERRAGDRRIPRALQPSAGAIRRRCAAGRLPSARPMGAVDEIRFEGLQRTNPEVLRSLLESKPGEPLTEEQLSADLRRIYGRGDFESVDYHIQQESGQARAHRPAARKGMGPGLRALRSRPRDRLPGENYFNILAQYRRTWLNRLGGEWLNEAQVGQNTYFATEFVQPLEERGRYFVAPYAKVGQELRGVFFNDQRVGEYQIERNSPRASTAARFSAPGARPGWAGCGGA